MVRFALLAASCAALCGCGEDVCDQAAAWAASCDVPWDRADDDTCRSHLRDCTARERDRLDAFWLCLDERRYFTCDPAAGDTAGGASPDVAADLNACRPELEGVSLACSSAIGIEGGTFRGLGSPE